MPNFKDISSFSEWTGDDKDQFALAVIKGLIMDTCLLYTSDAADE